ncbi:uncharacterized protein Z518_09878 [Rhinocladiella mackenziei CBS 650.93]|uniref:Clavaminate synthase-like protein n=1 Tax=Rhinocladiella mackenziei CBS 650.93 TaxID=1442369 RepID=A0A0D2GR64_9EURO|nr:uncharacterized protein Z518_09878 [Rhinocladiella mackenziei CBS 650.93]KIX00813.1 hypothetical protein Z518_09878 [Rhinocladiella mackenziei CBS 650.93]
MAIKHASPVTVSLHDLQNNTVPFDKLLSAFGLNSLGILVVTDLPPSFPSLRNKVLSNSSRLAALGPSVLRRLTKPSAKYLVGWSHGVETLRPGVIDTAKGSYYINCAFYKDPQLEGADASKFPGFEEYTAPNVWPADDEVKGFRDDAEQLIKLIIDTAVLVARACDTYAQKEIQGYEDGYLERVVRGSTTTKARLLHYFPTNSNDSPPAEAHQGGAETNGAETDKDTTASQNVSPNGDNTGKEDDIDDSWCTTHLDHGCLTGLTSAMFLDESAENSLTELPSSPDPSSGLYILSRSGQIHKVSIPRHSLAFQTGEALELITRGKFKAVPHFVKGVDPENCDQRSKIARNTLAVFTQPNLDELVDLETGLTFGEFARGVVKKNTAG